MRGRKPGVPWKIPGIQQVQRTILTETCGLLARTRPTRQATITYGRNMKKRMTTDGTRHQGHETLIAAPVFFFKWYSWRAAALRFPTL
jgi:hypothetical protein